MNKDIELKIKSAFHNWIITDPYPEYTEAKQINSQKYFFKIPVPEIGPHKAWRDGYEFAKKLIYKEFGL